MGRIHRIGQGRDVRLYNIVATDTREGDALARLLDNLVAAANELDGKMFDSLRLITEQTFDEASVPDLAQMLGRCFEGDSAQSAALEAVGRITAERLRQAHERQSNAEAHLHSPVELGAAHQVLHDDRLERINPHVVERFASVAASASAITFERSAAADTGFWLLGGKHMELPESLVPNAGEKLRLVATSSAAKQQAKLAGVASAAEAVVLGPGEDAFGELAEAVGMHVAPDLLRGGRLYDPNEADDYELHVYEGAIAEGRAAASSAVPQRRTSLITVCQLQPSSAAISLTVRPRPTRRVAQRAARDVKRARGGAISGDCSVNVPTAQSPFGHRQRRFANTSRTGRPNAPGPPAPHA